MPQPNPEIFGQYVDDLLAIDPRALGRRPPDLADLLTDLALGSPAILAARSLRGGASVGDDTRRRLAALIADAFWRLFNRPAVIALLRQLAPATAARDESAYWRLVLRYCQQGNLQAVLDESGTCCGTRSRGPKTPAPTRLPGSALGNSSRWCIRRALVSTGSSFGPSEGHPEEASNARNCGFRTVFALRFGQSRTDDGDYISQDAVRAAFNGPFRPFVLASTSIGQEGLDFHPWCHRLIHWNLPGNPVDLEQREGRIHRYKGHAVRRNVAASHALDAFASWSAGQDIWKLILRLGRQGRADRRRQRTGSALDRAWQTSGGAPCAATAVHDGDRGVQPAEAPARGLSGRLRATPPGGAGHAAGSIRPRRHQAQKLGSRSLTARDVLRILIDIDLPASAPRDP